ncbi:hypothetical protein HPP92_020277 [Vanilla planifolia]|uniref:Cyclin n=1 Tax=Vanilla planifolia TaxID=51239 RepID=A0A835UJM2_VANPL|nr:hypothetical protein HPP92_020682 [Vanilla planifolia]KAG0461801.1 hypothetical protein HPP92_020277 [Vanilla planifolia]
MAEVEYPHGIPRIIVVLSSVLQHTADCNDYQLIHPSPLPHSAVAFFALSKPEISIRRYLERIFRFARCSSSCYVVAYIYLDRFLSLHPSLALDSFNVHRLLITSILTAVKFMDDRYFNNAYFARVGGITLAEMNYLEVDFLFGLRFDLNVAPVIFASYCGVLEREFSLADPQIPPRLRLHCFFSNEENNNNNNNKNNKLQQQKQLIV